MAKPSKADVEAATRWLEFARRRTHAGEAHPESVAAAQLLGVLFQTLSPVIGVVGVAATFARSIKLSKAEHPCLEEVLGAASELPHNEPEVSKRLASSLHNLEPAAALETATGLYANFFRLLSSFIGQELLWQIVKVGFPDTDEPKFEETD